MADAQLPTTESLPIHVRTAVDPLESFFLATGVRAATQSAIAILEKFSLNEALAADLSALRRCAGFDAANRLVAARDLFACALEEPLWDRPLIPPTAEFSQFLQTLIGFRSAETLVVLFLDSSQRLICHEQMACGTASGVPFDARSIVLQALERHASGLILVHNHPSGDPRPSETDTCVTRRLIYVARFFGIEVYDHLIVALGRTRSMLRAEYDDHWN